VVNLEALAIGHHEAEWLEGLLPERIAEILGGHRDTPFGGSEDTTVVFYHPVTSVTTAARRFRMPLVIFRIHC
jgi:hypothetical protein